MPSGKGRSKEDTWKESDLKKAIQGDKKERSSRREDDRRERRSDQDDDRRRRDRKEDLINGEDRDHRKKERSSDKERRRDRDRNGERSGEKSDREKERRRRQEGETSRRERRERERPEKDKDSSKDRERQKERDSESTRKDRREQDKREREHEESRRRDQDRDRERDKDRERRHRSRREEGDDRRSDRKLKERDDETGSDDRRQDRERRRRREEGESSRHHDENRDQKRESSREKDHRDRRKERERDESRRHRDKSGERREKRRERDDRERRKEKQEYDADTENKVKQREREMLESLRNEEEEVVSKPGPSRGERFRADTLEEADVIDEEIKTRKSSIIKTEEFNNEAAYNYEEDFEDYEDDFENEQDDEDDTDLSLGDRNAGMQELLNAINLENETVSREGTKMSRSSDDDSRKEPEVRPVTAKGRINFVAAKQKQISEKVASRTRKRGQELMHLIDLDVVVFEMFDLPPMNEYELYIKNFGRSDTKQAYVQCNDDNLEKEIQTEDIETRTMWTQNPAEDFAGCGDEKGSQDESSSFSHATVDSVRLARFLQTAGQVCLVLLEEESAGQSNKIVKDKKEITCSDGYIPLATQQSYLAGRALECLHVSPVQNHLLLTAYGPVTTDQETDSSKMRDVNAKSIICLWNVNEPSTPQKILICESVPRCCCLSPSKATIAFAGLEDGSVVAWDLRESPSIHHSYNVSNDQVILRSPTFSTVPKSRGLFRHNKPHNSLLIKFTFDPPAGVLSQDNHHSPVVSLLPVIMPGDSAKASTSLAGNVHSDDMLGLSFQLASLEENAVMNIWVVVELSVADIAGSESDLGLAPGGKIKLIKSSSLPLEVAVRDVRKNTALQTNTMRFLPQDPNHFYIGTDSGSVLHRVRHGGRVHPKAFGPEIDCLVHVTTLDVSPWQLPCILVGNRDGSIRLYNLNNEFPVSTWTRSTQGSSIVSVQWSNSIPSVFFALDANSTLYIWDLLKNDSEPVAIEKVKQGSVTSFELSSDYAATGVGVAGRNAELILGYKSGLVEVHKISAPFSKASPDHLDRFSEYLEGSL